MFENIQFYLTFIHRNIMQKVDQLKQHYPLEERKTKEGTKQMKIYFTKFLEVCKTFLHLFTSQKCFSLSFKAFFWDKHNEISSYLYARITEEIVTFNTVIVIEMGKFA